MTQSQRVRECGSAGVRPCRRVSDKRGRSATGCGVTSKANVNVNVEWNGYGMKYLCMDAWCIVHGAWCGQLVGVARAMQT